MDKVDLSFGYYLMIIFPAFFLLIYGYYAAFKTAELKRFYFRMWEKLGWLGRIGIKMVENNPRTTSLKLTGIFAILAGLFSIIYLIFSLKNRL